MLVKNCQKIETELFQYGTILHENQTLSQIFFEWLCLKLNFFNMKDIPGTIIQFDKHNCGYEPQVKYNYMFSFDLFHVASTFSWFLFISISEFVLEDIYLCICMYINTYIYIYIYTCFLYESWFVLAYIKIFLKGPQVSLLLN